MMRLMMMIFSPPERKRNRRGRGKGIEGCHIIACHKDCGAEEEY